MEHINFSLTSLLLVTILSFLVPIAIKRIKRFYIPVVVGEIFVGMIIGKSGFDFIHMDESLHFIQFFGLAYLMFVAGLEIDFDIFSETGFNKGKGNLLKNPLTLSITILAISLSLAYATSYVLMKYNLVIYPLLMALIIGTTSLGVVVPILKEKGLSNTTYGQYIITGAVMADFVTMLLISVAVSLFKGGFSPEILLVFGLLILVFIFYRIGRKFRGNHLFEELAHGTTQIGIRGSFALMLLFVVLSQSIGVEMILGSFLAGTVISLISHKQREDIHHKLDAIGFGFLIPTFFILVGVNFDAGVLIENPKGLLLVPLLFILMYIIKGVPALLLKNVFSWRKSIAGGVLLTTKLSLTIAAAAIGQEIGAISAEVSAAILLVSILTSVVSPILFGKIIPNHKEEDDEKHVVIIGTTKQAILLAKRLVSLGIHVMLIESKREKVDEMLLAGIEIAWGDATSKELLEELEVQKARSVIVASGNDEINYQISSLLATEFPLQYVIVLLSDPYYIEKAQLMENLRVVNPNISVVSLLENMVRHPVTADILEDKRDLHMEEVEVHNEHLIGHTLRNARIPGEILIFSIYRKGETILPHGDTVIHQGDILLVLGTTQAVNDFRNVAIHY